MKRTEDSLRDLWDHIKGANFWIIGILEEEEKKKGYEKIFEAIRVENFPNMEKEIVKCKKHRVPYRINPRRNMPRHVLINCWRLNTKKEYEKPQGRNNRLTYKGNPIHLTADLSAETLQARGEWQNILKVLKGKNLHHDYCTRQGSHSKLMEK